MSAAIRLAPDGTVTGKPKAHPVLRVFVESGREDGYPITEEGLRALQQDPAARAQFAACALSFRAFLDVWAFLDQETGVVRVLGENLWEAQEAYVNATDEHENIFLLKARQLGETTVAVAYDGWVARFRTPSARVHCFSASEDASKQVLETVLFGLENLPPSMQVPMETTTRSIRLDYGNERALVRSYPSTRAASRGATCNHLHLDEWSAVVHSQKLMQSVTPSVAPGGTFHVITTELSGSESPTAQYYRRCVSGDGKHFALFCPATARPGRDEQWLEGMRRSLPQAEMSREYPMTWQEALAASGTRMFRGEDIDIAISQPRTPARTQAEWESRFRSDKKRRYSAGVDVGLKVDASVLVVLDVTDEIYDIAYYRYMKTPEVGELTAAINQLHRDFPSAHISVETNAVGWAIFQSIAVTESKKHEWVTTSMSKGRALGELQFLIERYNFSFDPKACPELDSELRGFFLPDGNIRQDTVAALWVAIGNAHHAHNPSGGRLISMKSYTF